MCEAWSLHKYFIHFSAVSDENNLDIFYYSFNQEEFYGRELILADRDMVEQQSNELFRDAKTEDIAFLVVGDPFG